MHIDPYLDMPNEQACVDRLVKCVLWRFPLKILGIRCVHY